MTRARVERPAEGRAKVLLSIDHADLAELDRLAAAAGESTWSRSAYLVRLIRAEVEREKRRLTRGERRP